MRNLIALVLVLAGLSYLMLSYPATQVYARLSLSWFLPGLALIFGLVMLLGNWFMKVIEQPPYMIFLLTMVLKMVFGLGLLLVYLVGKSGPANEGAITFLFLYLFFEILEIKRFVSILRPDSGERQSK
jgi:hypothetical protein